MAFSRQRFLWMVLSAMGVCVAACDYSGPKRDLTADVADTRSPTVAVDWPCSSEGGVAIVTGSTVTVSGNVTATVNGFDVVGVVSLSLKVDDVLIATVPTYRYEFAWDSTTVSDGAHTFDVQASDAAGNVGNQAFLVMVSNTGPLGEVSGTVSGSVYAPNGADPVPGALVYISKSGDASACESLPGIGEPPEKPYCTYAYSRSDGSFTLEQVPVCEQKIVIVKGALSKEVTKVIGGGNNALSKPEGTLDGDVAKMAVVTGAYDSIENSLAKLGLGMVSAGQLVLGTERFTLIDGAAKLDDAKYKNFDAFFSVPANFSPFRTIFLNCGNGSEDAFFKNAGAVAGLRAWVMAGGRLYCTDQAYDFCEQLFPDYLDFEGGAGNGLDGTPETVDAAQTGSGFDSTSGRLLDPHLKEWLQGLGVLNGDGSVHIEHWLGAWAPIKAVSPDVKVWVEAGVPIEVRPVTVTFKVGNGVVFVSSYHTTNGEDLLPTPQERVLQYLILSVL